MSTRPAGLEAAYADFAQEDAAIAATRRQLDARSAELSAREQALQMRKAELLAEVAERKAAERKAAVSVGENAPASANSSAAPLGRASRPADVIARHPEAKVAMANATVLLTGPTSGIGVHTAEALASICGRVVLAARSEERANALIADILTRVPSARLTFLPLELASLSSVDTCATSFLQRQAAEGWPPLKALILNAGVYTFSGKFEASIDGYERTFAVNHLGHFLLATRLLPALEAARPSRVVVVGSGSHFGPLETRDVTNQDALRQLASPSEAYRRRFWHGASARAYGSSKLCNTLFAKALHAKYYESKGIASCSLHPGTLMRSDMARDSPIANFVLKSVLSWFTKDLEQGAATSILCTLAPHADLGGAFFSDCERVKCSTLVTEEAAEALWQLSLDLCGAYCALSSAGAALLTSVYGVSDYRARGES